MNLFGLSFLLFALKRSAGKEFWYNYMTKALKFLSKAVDNKINNRIGGIPILIIWKIYLISKSGNMTRREAIMLIDLVHNSLNEKLNRKRKGIICPSTIIQKCKFLVFNAVIKSKSLQYNPSPVQCPVQYFKS